MMDSFHHIVKDEEEYIRLDKLLADLEPDESRSQIQRWILESYVTVNDQQVKSNYKCQLGDEIKWIIPEIKKLSILPEDIPLSIIFEDDDLIVINKPKGMVVHPTEDHQSGTLVNALLYHSKQLSKIAGVDRPGIVHRLDKDTDGLLVVAKTDDIHIALSKQFKEKTVERIYEAIVHGIIPHESGIIDAPIGRDPSHRLRMNVVDEGKDAVTNFQVLQRYNDYSHISCQLETGRTHQIRVHMNYIGHPLVGDPKYKQKNDPLTVTGQALFAKKIGFMHPGTNQPMQFEIEQPHYFQDLLSQIEERS